MKALEPPDTHYLAAANGWLELGNLAEARTELGRLSGELANHPEVLEARWLICAKEDSWGEALEIARELLRRVPERVSGWLHQAYALRRVADGGVKRAWAALLPAFDKFPSEFLISYNLSCYACQMKQLDAARVWFKRAQVIGGTEIVKRLALEDSDLEPLWREIKGVNSAEP